MMDKLDRAKKLAEIFLNIPIGETEFSPIIIMHPFFESAFLYDGENVFDALQEKEKYQIYLTKFYNNNILPCESLDELLRVVRKSYRLTFLKELRNYNVITIKECGNLLAGVWSIIENINNDSNVHKNQILRWVLKADKFVLMDDFEFEIFNSFSDEIIIYRGCSTPKGLKGLSWSVNLSKAKWFSTRFSNNNTGFVWKAKIRKEDIIAYLRDRGEEEVIVNFNKLYDIERIEYVDCNK